jgi:hypothetical protein
LHPRINCTANTVAQQVDQQHAHHNGCPGT